MTHGVFIIYNKRNSFWDVNGHDTTFWDVPTDNVSSEKEPMKIWSRFQGWDFQTEIRLAFTLIL